MKMINDSRYNTDDLQAIVDAFCADELTDGKPQLRWGAEKHYPPGGFAVHITEGFSGGSTIWTGSGQTPVRAYVKPTPWRAPHNVKLLNSDLILTNALDALTAKTDRDGYYRAPFDLAVQIYMGLSNRLGTTRSLTYETAASRVARLSGGARVYGVRYRIGPRRKMSGEGRALESSWKIYSKMSNVAYRASQTLHAAQKLQDELRILLDYAEGRDDLPFDPAKAAEMRDNLLTNLIPAVRQHTGEN